MLWSSVKAWLKGTSLSKRWQARVVEACVESSLLYDCQARVWYKRDMKKLQQFMDKCFRYVWSDRNGEPLRQMAERGMNMQDVRSRLGVKSVRWKIEKRVLERIGHVMRMENDRLTKVMVLGWYEGLEGVEKMRERKKKTVLYWKRLMNEAGWDWTDVERMANDRKRWKKMIDARMKHLYKWECQNGHGYEWEDEEERLMRDERVENELACEYEGCGKVCKSKAGLTVHQKIRHREAEERVRFPCDRCERVLETEVAKVNHERRCMGNRVREDGRIECGTCGRVISRPNVSRHRRVCRRMEVVEEEENGRDMEEEEVEDEWFLGFAENERRGHELNWFEGFEENERRENEDDWFEGFGGEGGRGRANEEMNGGQENERANEMAHGGMNEEAQVGAHGGEIGRVDGGRVYLGRRTRCRLCGGVVSYSNLARHERSHRVWDPGGGPHPV